MDLTQVCEGVCIKIDTLRQKYIIKKKTVANEERNVSDVKQVFSFWVVDLFFFYETVQELRLAKLLAPVGEFEFEIELDLIELETAAAVAAAAAAAAAAFDPWRDKWCPSWGVWWWLACGLLLVALNVGMRVRAGSDWRRFRTAGLSAIRDFAWTNNSWNTWDQKVVIKYKTWIYFQQLGRKNRLLNIIRKNYKFFRHKLLGDGSQLLKLAI